MKDVGNRYRNVWNAGIWSMINDNDDYGDDNHHDDDDSDKNINNTNI